MATSPPGQRRRGRPPKGTRGDTRQELLDAALRLFAWQGYAATTVRQIADEVGIRDSAIYAHFESKSELPDALVQEAGPSCVDELGPNRRFRQRPGQRLRRTLDDVHGIPVTDEVKDRPDVCPRSVASPGGRFE